MMDTPHNDDPPGGGDDDGDDRRHRIIGQQPGRHWDNLAEQRLEQLTRMVTALGKSVDKMRDVDLVALKEQRNADQRAADARGWKMDAISEKLSEISAKLDSFVTKAEFSPYKTGSAAMIGTILLAFLGGLLSLVFIKK